MKNKQYRNFIIFWLSQTISQLGSSMTSFAMIIWAYKQTGSAMSVSLLTFSSYLPYIIISLFAGGIVDKYKKKSILLLSDSVSFLCTVGIAILLMTGNLKIIHVYIANAIVGFMNAFQSPAALVAVGMMVPKEKLSNASGMNSFSRSMLAFITPMLAASIGAVWGLQGVIIIDMITFVFAFSLLLFIQIPDDKNLIEKKANIFLGSKQGFEYLMRQKGLWYLILSVSIMNFFSRLTYENIFPALILARTGGNDYILGLVSGIIGIGGVIGGLYVSFFRLPKNPIKVIYYFAIFSFIFGDILMGIGHNVFMWSLAGLIASVPMTFIDAGQNVVLYNHIPSDIRGRIFSLLNALQYASVPVALLLGGFLSDYVFEPFMASHHEFALLLSKIVGTGAGSGMAVLFLCTGTLGALSSAIFYFNKDVRALHK